MVINPNQLYILQNEKTVKKEFVYFFSANNLLNDPYSEQDPPAGRLLLTKKFLCYLSIGRKKEDSFKKSILKGAAKGLLNGLAFDHASDLIGFTSGKLKGKKREVLEKALANEYSFLVPLERIAGYHREKEGRFNPYKSILFMDIKNEDGTLSNYFMFAFRPDKPKPVNHGKWIKALDDVMKNITRTKYFPNLNQTPTDGAFNQNSTNTPTGNPSQSMDTNFDSQETKHHIEILKERLAKGEISKEEYFELKKILDS